MAISVIDPIGPAVDTTKQILFQPFDLGKWLRLGFCAFLMGLAGGGGGGFGGGGGPGGGPHGGRSGSFTDRPEVRSATHWVHDNLPTIVVVATVVVAVVTVFVLVLIWLSSRGHFMFLDGIVRNRGAVAEPWREYRREARSLFLFRLCLALAAIAAVFLVAGSGLLLALPDIRAERFGGMAVAAIVVSAASVMVLFVVLGMVHMYLVDFVVPIMYVRRTSAMIAWREFYATLFSPHMTAFLKYFLMKIVLSIGAGIVGFALACVTCCLAALPYVGSVILLPVTVFLRAYPLLFLEQFGAHWQILGVKKPPVVTAS